MQVGLIAGVAAAVVVGLAAGWMLGAPKAQNGAASGAAVGVSGPEMAAGLATGVGLKVHIGPMKPDPSLPTFADMQAKLKAPAPGSDPLGDVFHQYAGRLCTPEGRQAVHEAYLKQGPSVEPGGDRKMIAGLCDHAV